MHVPRRRRRDQPAGGHPPPGRLVRRGVPRGRLRRADDRRRGRRPPRADLGLAARVGWRSSSPSPRPSRWPWCRSSCFTAVAGRRRRAPRRDARRRGEHRAGPAQPEPTSGCSSVRPDWRSGLMRATVIGWWVAIALSGLLYGLIAKSAGATISGLGPRGVHQAGRAGNGRRRGARRVLPDRGGPGRLRGRRPDHRGTRPRSRKAGSTTSWSARSRDRRGSAEGSSSRWWSCWSAASPPGSSPGSARPASTPGSSFADPARSRREPRAHRRSSILGIGVLAFGIRPRVTSVVVYALLGWSLLVVDRRRLRYRQPLGARHLGLPPDGVGARRATELGGQRHHDRPSGWPRPARGVRLPATGPAGRMTDDRADPTPPRLGRPTSGRGVRGPDRAGPDPRSGPRALRRGRLRPCDHPGHRPERRRVARDCSATTTDPRRPCEGV